MTEDRTQIRRAQRARGNNVVHGFGFQKFSSRKAGHRRPVRQANDDHDVEDTLRKKCDNRDDEKERGNRQHDLNQSRCATSRRQSRDVSQV